MSTLGEDAVWPVLQAPSLWRTLDFISDLHLQASETATFDAWKSYMQQTRADAVFILGDLFEVWVGDDAVTAGGFDRSCAEVLQNAAKRLDLFFMCGNRDFLVGPQLLAICKTTQLSDPTVLEFGGQRWLLSHGDALCIADTDYQKFRALVRSAQWQQGFLGKPLGERRQIARELRSQSEARKKMQVDYADVDAGAAIDWLTRAQASHLIHGHTHKPARHVLAANVEREVLSDWDVDAKPPRAQVLRLALEDGQAVSVSRIAVGQA